MYFNSIIFIRVKDTNSILAFCRLEEPWGCVSAFTARTGWQEHRHGVELEKAAENCHKMVGIVKEGS